eukprot:9120396-Lingulodinium_polyedra.AAC.1
MPRGLRAGPPAGQAARAAAALPGKEADQQQSQQHHRPEAAFASWPWARQASWRPSPAASPWP